MSLENDLFTALSAIPEMARQGGFFAVFPIQFPQPKRYNPEWPAIRYTFVSIVPVVDICGDGDDSTADTRVQLDVVADSAVEMRAIRQEVMAIMSTFYPPAILASSTETDDFETKTFRSIMDYLVQPSSVLGSP